MNGDSAGEIHSSGREHLKREVARLASHDGDHGVDGGASWAGVGGIQPGFENRFGAIAGRRNPLGDLRPFLALLTIAEKLVDVRNADPGAHVLEADMLEALAHVLEEAYLDFIRR